MGVSKTRLRPLPFRQAQPDSFGSNTCYTDVTLSFRPKGEMVEVLWNSKFSSFLIKGVSKTRLRLLPSRQTPPDSSGSNIAARMSH